METSEATNPANPPAWQAEVLFNHRWGRHGERAQEEVARLHPLWEAARPLDAGSQEIAEQVCALEICNWNLEASILALCGAIGRREPTSLPIGHLASVSAERWQRVWAYHLALRSWLPSEGRSGYGALLETFDPDGAVCSRAASLLGTRTPVKELYVERLCLCLAHWLGGIFPQESAQATAHQAAVEAIEREIEKREPGSPILRAMRAEGDGKLQPCHHKAFRRYDIILSSIGAGSWRATMPTRGTDGFERADLLDRYLTPIEAWSWGEQPPEGELSSRIQALLGEPDEAGRFLAALLASLLRAQQLSARRRAAGNQ